MTTISLPISFKNHLFDNNDLTLQQIYKLSYLLIFTPTEFNYSCIFLLILYTNVIR